MGASWGPKVTEHVAFLSYMDHPDFVLLIEVGVNCPQNCVVHTFSWPSVDGFG